MKLAIVRQKYTPFGGAERFVERALGALRQRGVDVTVIARLWSGDVAGLRCDPFYLGRTWRDAGFAREVRRIIDSGRFDIVQSHERIPGCHIFRAGDGVHATWLERRGKRSDWASPWHRYTLAAETAMFHDPNLRLVICNSHMVKHDIAARFSIDESRLKVVYNGIDLASFHPQLREQHRQSQRQSLGTAAERPVVLFVGSGFERKGLPTLLAAMREVDAELWVVGRDKAQTAMEDAARRYGIAGRVRFFGGQKDVRPFYGAADVVALPTLYDPFPNVALEALACGLPLVTSDGCGAAELLTDAAGQVVGAGDTALLAGALHDVLQRHESMREPARASVAHLGLEAMAAQLVAIYDSMSVVAR
jgi:UDP-glucose:(heptosyl)LPS alpha-1,3-glucosyltransferase